MSNEISRRSDDGPYSKGAADPDIHARPNNWFVPVTLVLLKECTNYGYELMERMLEFGCETVNPATLYRTLRKMERDGLCSSEWQTNSQGPARRMYSITEAGIAHLDLWVEALEQYQRNVDTFFQAYRRGDSSGTQQSGGETS